MVRVALASSSRGNSFGTRVCTGMLPRVATRSHRGRLIPPSHRITPRPLFLRLRYRAKVADIAPENLVWRRRALSAGVLPDALVGDTVNDSHVLPLAMPTVPSNTCGSCHQCSCNQHESRTCRRDGALPPTRGRSDGLTASPNRSSVGSTTGSRDVRPEKIVIRSYHGGGPSPHASGECPGRSHRRHRSWPCPGRRELLEHMHDSSKLPSHIIHHHLVTSPSPQFHRITNHLNELLRRENMWLPPTRRPLTKTPAFVRNDFRFSRARLGSNS